MKAASSFLRRTDHEQQNNNFDTKRDSSIYELYALATGRIGITNQFGVFPIINLERNCYRINDAIELLESTYLETALSDEETVLFLKLHIDEKFIEISSTILHDLTVRCANKAILVFMMNKVGDKISIYWKSKKILHFLIFKHYRERIMKEDAKVYEFIVNFLLDALSKDDLGVLISTRHQGDNNKIKIEALGDYRDYTILPLAAEAGNSDVVEILLQLGLETETSNPSINAQTLAWDGRHSDVLLLFAKANMPYPKDVDQKELSDNFKKFYHKTEMMHEAIISGNKERVEEILQNNDQKLKYFLNLQNESAAKVSLNEKDFEIYEILQIYDTLLAPEERTQEVFKNFTKQEQKKIRDIHTKHSKDLPNKHINVLMAHSLIAHHVSNHQEKLNHVQKAYEFLSNIPCLNTILKVVATSKKLRIIYDFESDSVYFSDPTTSEYTEGIFYMSGRIYIGAKLLLDENEKYKVIAVIIHELCHYAITLVFENFAKPFSAKATPEVIKEYERLFGECKRNRKKDPLIEIVYETYPKNIRYAELIVRAPHFMALHYNNPVKLEELRELYPRLFNFFENFVIPELEKSIADIDARDEKKLVEKNIIINNLEKNLKLTWLFCALGLILIATVIVLVMLNNLYPYKSLSTDNQERIIKSFAIFKGSNVTFGDLYPGNLKIYHDIKSDHVEQILQGKLLNLSKIEFMYLSEKIYLNWTSLPDVLKTRIYDSYFELQGKRFIFRDLIVTNTDFFKLLTHEQLTDILDDEIINIGKKSKPNTLYQEREFIQASTIPGQSNPRVYILNDLLSPNNKLKTRIISTDSNLKALEILKEIEYRVKENIEYLNSTKWVANINLSNVEDFLSSEFFSNHFNVNKTICVLKKFLTKDSKSKFESKLVESFIDSGDVIFLWNKYDEMSIDNQKFTLQIFDKVHEESKYFQFIAVKLSTAKILEDRFNVKSYSLKK